MAKVRTTSEVLDQNPGFTLAISKRLWQLAAEETSFRMENPMAPNIAYFLELEDEEFDLNEAMEFYRDMRVEIEPHTQLSKYLAKLDKRIKNYIRDYGQVPQIKNVRTDIIPKKNTKKVDVAKTEILAGRVLAMGQPEISQMILDLVEEKPNTPAIKFIFEDLVYK